MDATNEKPVSHLKLLLSICNDGKAGYQTAAENADAAELKALFSTYSIQRSEFAMELKKCIHQCGADPDNDSGGPIGALHRVWMDIKTALTSKDNKAILDACITGEKAAIEAYDEALEDFSLYSDVKEILISQRADIAECLKNVDKLALQYANS